MWLIQEVVLDSNGRDKNGWKWGCGERLWHFSDGVDSLTVRASSQYEAFLAAQAEGWPPPRTGRFNWGREYGTYV